jgi:hypothetical protein
MMRVVIPHYGPQELIDRAVESVKIAADETRLPGWQTMVMVINNNERNRYFTGAVNAGLSARNVPPADAFWIFNNDAIADPDCAKSALEKLMGGQNVAAVGSRNISIREPDRITWGGSGPVWPTGRHIVGSVAAGDCAAVMPQEWMPFASVFIRRDALEEVGLLDRNMAHICSDADWCFRARWAGGQILYDPGSQIRHDFGSSAKPSETVARIMRADLARFAAKWRGQWMAHLSVWPAE